MWKTMFDSPLLHNQRPGDPGSVIVLFRALLAPHTLKGGVEKETVSHLETLSERCGTNPTILLLLNFAIMQKNAIDNSSGILLNLNSMIYGFPTVP